MKRREHPHRTAALLLAVGLLVGICGGGFAAAEYGQYELIYDMVEEGMGRRPMTLEDMYDKYGTMNGDYYKIALEREFNAPDGICTIAPLSLIGLMDEMEKNGEISLSMRTKLRKSVEKYGLECPLPNNPAFPDGEAEMPTPTRQPSTGSEYFTPEEIDEMNNLPAEPSFTPTESPALVGDLQYADVTPDAWYYEAVTAMSEGGLFKGYDDGLFHPNDNITYGQWAMLMSRIAVDNYSYEMKPGDHWAQEAYSRTSRDGICDDPNKKCGETLDSLYNRAQAISRAYCLAHYDKRGLEDRLISNYSGQVWTFDNIPDGKLIQQRYTWFSGEGDWHSNSTGRWVDAWVLEAYNLGITHGIDANGTCNPTAPITRAEVAQLLYNMGITQEKQCDLRVGGIGS